MKPVVKSMWVGICQIWNVLKQGDYHHYFLTLL